MRRGRGILTHSVLQGLSDEGIQGSNNCPRLTDIAGAYQREDLPSRIYGQEAMVHFKGRAAHKSHHDNDGNWYDEGDQPVQRAADSMEEYI